MRQAGLNTLAIEDAIGVGSVFAMFVRVADALGFTAPTRREGKTMARMLGFGYDKHSSVAEDFPRHAAALQAVAQAVSTVQAPTEPALRAQLIAWVEDDVFGREPATAELPEALRTLVAKETRHAYKIVDEDLARLGDAGFEAAAIYDVIVTVAAAAGTARYKKGLAAMRDFG